MSALSIVDAAWHAQRRQGIGASDVPAIAGISTYAKPIDVWQQKVGLVEPQAETPLTRWGHLLEPVIADEFTTVTGIKVRRLSRAVHYRDWPVLFAHLDRTAGDAILECKSAMSSKGWGETGTNEIPDAVALQVQAQLAAADREVAHVAALIGYRDFRHYTIQRDRALFDEAIMPLLREFWQLVETETPPEPDGSDSYGRFLRDRTPTDDGTERAATPEEQVVGNQYVEVLATKVAAEIREEELKQRLMDAMGTTTKLDGPGWRISWKQSKDRETVAWKLLAGALRAAIVDARESGISAIDALDLDALESIYTESKPGSRPFLFTVNAGEAE